MTLKELEQDVEDYKKTKDEALQAVEDAVEWNDKCFERLFRAQTALLKYKLEHPETIDKTNPF